MPRPARSSRTAPDPPTAAGPSSVWLFVVGLLLAARYLQPTEAVVFGETLWQAQLWLVAAAAWCWAMFRSGRVTFRLSLLDAFLWLLVVGHALTTLPVLIEGGDRRAAVNVVWEWAGLAATLFLIRQVLSGFDLRRTLAVFAAVAVALAAFGVWQHHVSLPETATRYNELDLAESELAARVAAGEATRAEQARLAEVRRELAGFGVPPDEAARRQWEDRVRSSTEPFATFALANTLAGFLAAALPILFLRLRMARRNWGVMFGLAASAAVVFYCLVLTKSRTAWVGLAAGTAVGFGLHLLRGRIGRSIASAAAASAAGVVLLGLLAVVAGGLDRQVVSEAPKSLQYRLDYWTGALSVLSERPLLGTGPGNFRSFYLEHRPVDASEEVAAPHNLFLDIWTAGGLISLVTLIGLLGFIAYRLLRSPKEGIAAVPDGQARWTALETGAAAAFPVLAGVHLLGGDAYQLALPLLAIWPAAVLALFCLNRPNASAAAVVGAGAGFVALFVHLLGADGIEFPAVVQTLLLFSAVVDRPREVVPTSSGFRMIPMFLFGGLTLGCLLTGLVPVLNAGALTARAEAMLAAGDPSADRVLVEASEADSLAVKPLMLRAELATSRALSSGSSTDLEVARRRWGEVLAAEPRSLHARQRLAELLLAHDETELTAEAAELLGEAVRLSPTDSALRGRYAIALAAANRPDAAAKEAAAALRLDDVNRAAGHADRVFDEETRSELERLASVGQTRPGP